MCQLIVTTGLLAVVLVAGIAVGVLLSAVVYRGSSMFAAHRAATKAERDAVLAALGDAKKKKA